MLVGIQDATDIGRSIVDDTSTCAAHKANLQKRLFGTWNVEIYTFCDSEEDKIFPEGGVLRDSTDRYVSKTFDVLYRNVLALLKVVIENTFVVCVQTK